MSAVKIGEHSDKLDKLRNLEPRINDLSKSLRVVNSKLEEQIEGHGERIDKLE
jgi:hypothetical protein